MQIKQIDDPIATRKLIVGDDIVLVTIGKPKVFDDGNDFYCPYSIEYLGKTKVSYAGGVDAVQAIQLTMKKIGTDLSYLETPPEDPVTWMPDAPGDTGFPT